MWTRRTKTSSNGHGGFDPGEDRADDRSPAEKTVRNADQILVLDQGRIVQQGTKGRGRQVVAVNLYEKSAPGCNNLAQPGVDPVIVTRAAVFT